MSDAAIHNMTIGHVESNRASLLGRLSRWWARRQELQQLARFSQRELQDIGLTRADVHSILDRPFWRA